MKIQRSSIPEFFVFLGIFRSIGSTSVFLHLPAFAFGLADVLRGRLSKNLLPALFLGLMAILSCIANNLGPINYLKALMLIGGVGMASIVSRMHPDRLAKIVSGPVLYGVMFALLLETVLIAAGLGERERTLDSIIAGLGGIELPRYMGFRGGSAFTSILLGVLGLVCWAHRYRWQAVIYLLAIFMMMSRGPLLGLAVVALYALIHSQHLRKLGGWILILTLIASPLLVHVARETLPPYLQMRLIEVSTMRYYSFMAFLDFGLENPFFGIGYDNFLSNFIDYSKTYEGRTLGTFREHRLHEAHNLVLDIWGELGLFGYAFLSVHLLVTWRLICNTPYAAAFLYMAACLFFVSGASDWAFWVVPGVAMAYHRTRQASPDKHPRGVGIVTSV